VKGRLNSKEEYDRIVVRALPDGSLLRLRDVARTELAARDYSAYGRLNGNPSTLVIVNQSPGSNALEVISGVRAAMERAKAFGTDKLRVFTFMLGKGETPNEKSYARVWELTREAARRAKGFRLAVENIGGGYVATGAESALLFKNVREDNIGLVWDPNNAGASGEQSFPEGYRKLDPARIFHIHLRDYKHQDGKVVWARVGDGEFDNLGQIRALLKDGFQGTFTLETHWADPKGKMYSSEQSLKGLLEVIAKV
jgi:sugar phosphate isomerase/epimerase